jgi:hypothetical protein
VELLIMDNIFNKEFWIDQWENDKKSDTFNVHRGFSTPEYWDNAAATYNKGKKEVKARRLEKIVTALKEQNLLFDRMKVLRVWNRAACNGACKTWCTNNSP